MSLYLQMELRMYYSIHLILAKRQKSDRMYYSIKTMSQMIKHNENIFSALNNKYSITHPLD